MKTITRGLGSGLLLLSALAGCSGSAAPKCSAADTVDLVMEIAGQHMTVAVFRRLDGARTAVEGIVTTGVDRQTGTQFCEAAFVMETAGIRNAFPITYTSAWGDDGLQYVTVYGL